MAQLERPAGVGDSTLVRLLREPAWQGTDNSYRYCSAPPRYGGNDPLGFLPNAQFTHITMEGDEGTTGNEALEFSDGPGLETFTPLTNSFNPLNDEFNSTITRPLYAVDVGTGFLEFQNTSGINGDGYEIDFPGPDALEAGRTGVEIGASWGVDVDTHHIAGNDATGELWNFAQPGSEAEQIAARFSAGDDLILLISGILSVTNFPLADIEIFKSESGVFKVDGTGQYLLTVTNNGNYGLTGGAATGQILVADTLPTGLTLDSVSGTGWDCSLTSADAFTCIFDIALDCDATTGCITTDGELHAGESLSNITADILVGGISFFPSLSNNVKNVGRVQHNGGSCVGLVAGVIPDPADCIRGPQFDIVNLQTAGVTDLNDLDDKTSGANNVDGITTEVRGRETDLGVTKVVDGILEEGGVGAYTITVSNFGPDNTTGGTGGTITVTDLEPAGVTFDNAAGTGWICSLGPLNCTYAGILTVGNSATITLDVTVTGSAGQNVSNTASVTSGTYNFDSNGGNNTDADITKIVAAPVSSNEKFLISVSTPGNSTQIGGLAAFENDDYIVYNPLIDTGTLFYDNSGEGYSVNDADAIHLFTNAHIALSADASSTIGSNSLVFEPEDIVVWDPILKTATMLFDGSAIFDGPIDADDNIDAVYVKSDGRIIFSTEGPASITYTGPTTLNFNQGDVVEYDPSDGSATILIDSSDADIFGAEVQVDAIYLRVDDSDSYLTKDVYVLSVNEISAIIGACGSCDPVAGTTFSRDDIVEIDLTGANPVTQILFRGDLPLGVFTPPDSGRTIDALQVVEDGYIGHFAISQSQAGSTCQAGQITIRKHKGLTHSIETDYAGSILITTGIGQGDWSIAVGSGTIDNGIADDGAATYTFVPADNGEVTLYLIEETISTLNVNVNNSYVPELGSEDPNFSYNDVITNVTYRDEWSAVAFDNNDGSTFWATDWIEADGEGVGPATGNIFVVSSKLAMTSTVGDPNPQISRTADLSLFAVTETVFLNFDYSYQFLNSGSDVLVVEARPSDAVAFTTVQTFSGLGGTNLTPQSVSLDLTALLGSPVWTDTTEIRLRITGGYTGTSRFFFDNIELATGTTDCGIGSIDHYQIEIDGFTGNSATLVPGISCVGSIVTITGHDSNDFPSASDEIVTLLTSTGEGDWTLLSGFGAFNNGTLGDGIATYDFAPSELSATFMFNYTDPDTDLELVNFNMNTAYSIAVNEDPTLEVSQAGLLFYDETMDNPTSLSPIPTQIAGKPSNVNPDLRLITVEAVRTSDNDPLACSPLFDAGNTLSIGFAGECQDPGVCSPTLTNQFSINGTVMTPASNNAGPGTTATFTPLDILMVDQGAGHVGGDLFFTYADAGQIEIHARYQIPLNNNLEGTPSGDFLVGNSLPFVVRPFAFDIDFDIGVDGGRDALGVGHDSYAVDANASTYAQAGIPFDTTVTAVQWDPLDDVSNLGVPDTNAELWDNDPTPNFGNESTAASMKVLVDSTTTAPAGDLGTLTNNEFTTFTNGAQTHTMIFDEVGIIDLDASLVDLSNIALEYLGSGETVVGHARNVGRFYPASLEVVPHMEPVISRAQARMQTECIIDPMSLMGMDADNRFTYMGEEFSISFDIQAQNAAGVVTENYVDGFAKLANNNLGAGTFSIFEELAGPDNNLSSRRALGASGVSVNWPGNGDSFRGIGMVAGRLVLNKRADGVPDGPYVDTRIGLNTADSDGAAIELTIDIDEEMPIANDTALIGDESFRYGRLLVDNTFGPETEPLGIPFRVEYWNDGVFETNVEDSCTTLFFGTTTPPSAISFLTVPGSYTDQLTDGDTAFESAADVELGLFEGQTAAAAADPNEGTDRPLVISAPGETNEGTVVVEFDLDHGSLPFSLDFLSYDWRGAAELENINEDGDYSDNPRGRAEFGSYRGHDRIVNWQEVFIGTN